MSKLAGTKGLEKDRFSGAVEGRELEEETRSAWREG